MYIEIGLKALGVLLVIISIAGIMRSIKSLFASGKAYAAVNKKSQNLMSVIRGEIDPHFRGRRDYRVSRGMVINLRSGEIAPQGRISDEMIEPLVK